MGRAAWEVEIMRLREKYAFTRALRALPVAATINAFRRLFASAINLTGLDPGQ